MKRNAAEAMCASARLLLNVAATVGIHRDFAFMCKRGKVVAI